MEYNVQFVVPPLFSFGMLTRYFYACRSSIPGPIVCDLIYYTDTYALDTVALKYL